MTSVNYIRSVGNNVIMMISDNLDSSGSYSDTNGWADVSQYSTARIYCSADTLTQMQVYQAIALPDTGDGGWSTSSIIDQSFSPSSGSILQEDVALYAPWLRISVNGYDNGSFLLVVKGIS